MRHLLVAVLTLSATYVLACGESIESVCDLGAACQAQADAGSTCDAGTFESDLKPGCVTDAIGIFVASSGLDTNAGTRAAPVKTISHALSLAQSGSQKRIYACGGVYNESIAISETSAIYGGFKCSDWSWSATAVPATTIVGQNPAFAISIAASDVALVALTVNAAAATEAGESSIGIVVGAGAARTRLVSLAITAAAGKDGAPGAATSNYDPKITRTDAAIAGNSASGGVGGPEHACMLCTDQQNSDGGGGGGAGGSNQPGGSGGGGGSLQLPGGAGGSGGSASGGFCSAGANGSDGAPAAAATSKVRSVELLS